jgi:hypothetical protein
MVRYCLRHGIYNNLTLIDEQNINKILTILKTGSKMELIMNVLLFTDFKRWNRDQIVIFIEETKNLHRNVMLCYNPILSICLACEYLEAISQSN